MKPQLLIRTITIIVIVLLCAGISVYSFWCLDREESLQDFNLYTLVPQDAVAVLETDYVERLIDDVEQLSCSKDGYYLYVSEIFTYLKNHLHALLDDTPHGLSTQMNRALISFHAPDNPINQVLYCGLGTEDYDLVGAFWDECSLGPFPVKTFDYRRRKIYIYPMENGLFLSVFFTRHFMVAGFQKKLVEQVIDTYLDKNNSLLEQPEFELVYEDKQRRGSSAVLYANLNAVKMGAASDTSQVCARLGNWCGFDLRLDGDVIYCAGMYNDTDSLSNTYMNALRRQQALKGFPDAYLPTSTFYYHCWSASDKKAILRYADSLHYVPSFYGTNVEQWHKAYADFWLDYGGESMISAYFMSTDAADKRPCSVLISSLKNELSAERQLRSLLYAIPYDKGLFPGGPSVQKYLYYSDSRRLRVYTLPGNTMFTQLTGMAAEKGSYVVACFYQGCLLMASDLRALSAYITAVENEEQACIISKTEWLEALSSSYNSLIVMDMEKLSCQPIEYLRQIPAFFCEHAAFFKRFLITIQLTYTEGIVYPCLTMFYKGNI